MLECQEELEEEDNIIVKWAQEGVETLHNLLINKQSSVLCPASTQKYN